MVRDDRTADVLDLSPPEIHEQVDYQHGGVWVVASKVTRCHRVRRTTMRTFVRDDVCGTLRSLAAARVSDAVIARAGQIWDLRKAYRVALRRVPQRIGASSP